MKLSHPFCRLPLRVDLQRLLAEAAAFAEPEWSRHTTGFPGNSALRLITVGGGDNDDMLGRMAPTPALQRSPYIRQILAGLGVVWSRSRLMRLAPGATVPSHCDVNYHWFNRVRVHIPVVTDPAVSFRCGGETVHMAAGEVWIFDNWRLHEVENRSAVTRIHLVADTTGSAAFWRLVAAGQTGGFDQPSARPPELLPFRPGIDAQPRCEQHVLGPVMHPSEVEMLSGDLISELAAPATPEEQALHRAFVRLATEFCREWRQLWMLHGDTAQGWPEFQRLRDFVQKDLARFEQGPRCAANGVSAAGVWQPRVLLHACRGAGSIAADLDRTISSGGGATARPARAVTVPAPLFIVAAPRSGSTLLYETLAQAPGLFNLGGEAHWLVEDIEALRPGAPGVSSNRLTAQHARPEFAQAVLQALGSRLRDRDGAAPAADRTALRFLEKTPKNALRIPFFDRIFPDARFVFLWRDPRENLSSIMEAWRSGGWVTYRDLPGQQGPWSLLLPPQWQELAGRPLEEIAAFQWSATNRIVLDDLAALPASRWIGLSYAELLADPLATVRRICEFGELDVDARLLQRVSAPLPLSRHTLTPPDAHKWRKNGELIERVMPQLEPLHQRLRALAPGAAGA